MFLPTGGSGKPAGTLVADNAHPPLRRSPPLQEVARNRTDMWNAAIGGCVAGATVGLHRKSLGSTAFGCLAFGAAGALTDVYVNACDRKQQGCPG